MFNCKDLKMLSVLSLYEGELLGVVDKLLFDKKLKKLCMLELIGEDGARFYLPTKNIYHIGKNAITVKNNQSVIIGENCVDYCVAPLNLKAYSITGEFLGVVEEISLNEKFITTNISLENSIVLDVKNIVSVGKNTVIFYDKSKKVNISKFVPKQPDMLKNDEEVKVEILPEEKVDAEPKVATVEKHHLEESSKLLINRVCTKDIFNFNNELLIKAYGIVNKRNLKEIIKYNKLRELMLFIK